MRICSFLPSATEIVYALGLHDQLYGVTFECDYPAAARHKPKVVRSLFEHIDPPLSSGDISQIIGQRLQEGLGIYEVDQEALQAAEPDLLLVRRSARCAQSRPAKSRNAVCAWQRHRRFCPLTRSMLATCSMTSGGWLPPPALSPEARRSLPACRPALPPWRSARRRRRRAPACCILSGPSQSCAVATGCRR
jgi:hypothetical protein